MRQRASLAVVLALAVLALSGCFRVDVALTVSSANAVNGTAVIGVDRSVAQSAGGAKALVERLTKQLMPQDVPTPGRITSQPFQDASHVGVTLTLNDVPLSAFAADTSHGPSWLSITRDGDRFVVAGAVDLTPATLHTESDPALQQQLKSATVSVSLTFPGPVPESNGQISGNTVSWQPPMGQLTHLAASASAGDSAGSSGVPLFPWAVVAGGVLLAVVVLLGIVLVLRSRARAARGRHRHRAE